MENIKLSEIDYPLPNEKIAFFPLEDRDQSKLLVYKNKTIIDATFKQLADFLDEECALIFNDSKVIHARLLMYNQHGAKIEVFLLEPVYPTRDIASVFSQTGVVAWKCFVGNAKKFRNNITFDVNLIDSTSFFQSKISVSVEKGDRVGDAFLVTFMWDAATVSFAEWLDAYGKMPLPPYIRRDAVAADEVRYQTIYAQQQGSVAAPTAGLHFSENVLQSIRNKNIVYQNITLHVGAGTFKSITTDTVFEHGMHQEQVVISRETIGFLLQNRHKKIVAVGTTVVRALESLFIMGAKLHLNIPQPFKVEQFEIYRNSNLQEVSVETSLTSVSKYMEEHNLQKITVATSLMILPQYRHAIAKGLITNFHQPKSTLLLLISSYLGASWREVYVHALTQGYRFLSYGDSNLYL